jgi:hypothetical protein
MNGGQSWDKAAGNLEQDNNGNGNGPSCRDAEIIPLGNDTLYLVGTTVGLFATSNIDGVNTIWEQIGVNALGSTIIEYINYRSSDGLLVVGTFGNGVYQTNLTNTVDILDFEKVKTSSIDYTIFPNPIIDRSFLSINLERNYDAKIIIFDEIGRKVIEENRKLNIGKNNIELDLTNFKGGIYFVSLTINNKTTVKQIIKD